MALDQLIDDAFERDAVQGITGMRGGRCHIKVLSEELSKIAGSKASSSARSAFCAIRTSGILRSAFPDGEKTPWRMRLGPAYLLRMKHNILSRFQKKRPANAPRPTSAALSRDEINFTPSTDEVARRAYFSYENEGSLPGHDVQHWLKAKADLTAERKLTRVHGFHNQT